MSHWPFIIGSYVLAVGGTFMLGLWSYAAMRQAERRAESMKSDR